MLSGFLSSVISRAARTTTKDQHVRAAQHVEVQQRRARSSATLDADLIGAGCSGGALHV